MDSKARAPELRGGGDRAPHWSCAFTFQDAKRYKYSMNSVLKNLSLVAALLLLACAPLSVAAAVPAVVGANVSATTGQPNKAPSEPAAPPRREGRATQDDLGERLTILEARSEAQSDLTEWFAILIAVVGIGFGGLVTGIVVFFALRTEKSAVAAAKDEVASSRRAIDKHVTAAEAAAATTRKIADEIEIHRKKAEETTHDIQADAEELRAILEKAGVAEDSTDTPTSLTVEEQQTLSDAASSIAEKSVKELTSVEFEVALADASQKEDWYRMRDLARALRIFHVDDEGVARSLSAEASALFRIGQNEEAHVLSNEIITRFEGSNDPVVRERVIQALYNKAILVGQSDIDESLKFYGAVIRRYRSNATKRIRLATAKSLCNRAVLYAAKGETKKSLTDFTKALQIIGDDRSNDFLEPLINTAVGKASLLMEKGRKKDALACLALASAEKGKIREKRILAHLENAEQYFGQFGS